MCPFLGEEARSKHGYLHANVWICIVLTMPLMKVDFSFCFIVWTAQYLYYYYCCMSDYANGANEVTNMALHPFMDWMEIFNKTIYSKCQGKTWLVLLVDILEDVSSVSGNVPSTGSRQSTYSQRKHAAFRSADAQPTCLQPGPALAILVP